MPGSGDDVIVLPTGVLKLGADYMVTVTLLGDYKTSTPASQTFKWNATMVTLPKFVVK